MSKKRIFIILSSIFILCLYLAIFAGARDNGIHLFYKFFDLKGDTDSVILEILRIPRAIKALIAGSTLALAGMFLQAVSKNPLAEPYITGISSGAGVGIVFSIIFLGGLNYSLFGVVGAILSSLTIILFAGFNKISITKLILIGLSLNIFVSSLISLSILLNPDKAYALMFILSGGVTNSNVVSNKLLIGLFVFVLILSALFVSKLNFLRLDDSLVKSIKKKKNTYVFLIVVLSAFLTSISVFSAGIIGFIGIIAPQISKMILGGDYRTLFFSNILIGASLMLFSDFVSRSILYPLEIPLGLVVSVIGAPIFVFFLTRKGQIFND